MYIYSSKFRVKGMKELNDTRKKARGLKIALVVVSILVIISLIANSYFYFKTGDLQSQVNDLTSSQNSLESQVTNLTSSQNDLQSQVDSLTSEKLVLQSQVANLSNDFNDLQNQVDVIEDKIDLKEWTFVGEYTLANSKQEETFHVTGEKWRFTWAFPFTFTGGSLVSTENVRIYDENGYLLGGFTLGDKINEQGIYYIGQGDGNFTIRISGVNDEFTFPITVESYC